MFATLDPVSRRLRFPRDREVIITDTVGFIRDLPPDLVTAFRATLEELSDASVLLHVVDVSAPDHERRIEAVRGVLRELSIPAPELVVFNQMDRVPPEESQALAHRHSGVAVSALKRTGLRGLLERVEQMLWDGNNDQREPNEGADRDQPKHEVASRWGRSRNRTRSDAQRDRRPDQRPSNIVRR